MQFTNLISFLILLLTTFMCRANYCEWSRKPICMDKPHLLCQPRYEKYVVSENDQINVLKPLNDFRKRIRKVLDVCNLNIFQWNNELAQMAQKTSGFDHNQFCSITLKHKNNIVFNHKITDESDLKDTKVQKRIRKQLVRLTDSIDIRPSAKDPLTSWAYSAFSTEIGCIISPDNYLHCVISGIQLDNFSQSFGFGSDCNATKSNVGESDCHSTQSDCTNDHTMCNPLPVFQNIEPMNISFTSRKFILTKFEKENKNAAWDIDLQYFAERIVNNSITDNDKCLALEKYPTMWDFHFNSSQIFHDQISIIDYVWKPFANVSGKIGCVLFKNRTMDPGYIHVYCLTGQHRTAKCTSVACFLKFIGFDKNNVWLIYVLLILTYLDILGLTILLKSLINLERKRFLFNF